MKLGVASLVMTAALAGCGGKSWPADQATRVTNSVKSWVLVQQLCTGPSVATTCTPTNMRVLAHSSICPEASGLYSHGDPVPNTGAEQCPIPK